MPQRATSRGLLFAGVTLIVVSGALAVSPVLLGRPNMAKRLVVQNIELGRVAERVNRIRDVTDELLEARGAGRAYLLTGSPKDRAVYQNQVTETRASLASLTATSLHPPVWAEFDGMADRLLTSLARGVALQDAGQHDAAVVAIQIDASRDLVAAIKKIADERLDTLYGRYRIAIDDIRDASDYSDRFARVVFCLAGASFALGTIALAAYLRRRIAAEAELRAGRDAARAASLLKTSFVATVSHDLRQPLHAISMFIGVLRRRSDDPKILMVVENIATAVASMQRMFAALLDVARLDARAIEIEPRTVDLREVFDGLEVEFAASAAAKGLALQFQPTSLCVATDPALLETILRNLLTNAVKFTDRGWVGIATRRRLEQVEIIVFDTGIGIAAEDQRTIFGQFERLAQPGGAREGLGLGLSIVQRTADLLGATVTLESEPGHGSRFILSLPHAEPEQPAAAERAARELELHGHRILVLDDHPDARKAVALAIETLGGVPMEAASPDEARRLLAEMEPARPWAAVVDHDLGGEQTGPRFLDAYAADAGHALPAVVITGSTDASTLASLAASGRPWLIKPIDLNTLCLALSRLAGAEAVQ
jgi:signal transduction histidine kinase/CheY-like chemotaxis protein